MKNFHGRQKELTILQNKFNQPNFHMSILYGRRRIGKTTLINHFINRQSCKCISFVAVERDEAALLSMLTETVLTELAPDLLGTVDFQDFEKLFAFIGNYAAKERIIFFIDEYPYLARQCPYIQSVLQKIIDTNWSRTNLFFILCGSLVGFMKDEVLSESAPLHGRSDLELRIQPFNYRETAEFLDGYTFEEKTVVYGLTNGIAKYVEQFNPTIPLEENIINQFFDMGGYFTEEQVKTVITNERQNPMLYQSIISAIACGHSKNSEIASYAHMDDITYPLKVLTKAEIIEKRYSNKPYYVLNDSMLEFWFRYVSRAASAINAGKGTLYYNKYVKDNLHEFMGKIFEKMAKEYILAQMGTDSIPLLTELTDYQKSIVDENKNHRQIELDLVGWGGKEILLAGECKFKNKIFDWEDYQIFLDKINYLPSRNPKLILFSLSGFSQKIKNEDPCVTLVCIKDMYL